jgi:hypothetical protein
MTLEQKALSIIEGICLTTEPNAAVSALELIYKCAHTARARECVLHNHPAWEDELNAMYDMMVNVKVL